MSLGLDSRPFATKDVARGRAVFWGSREFDGEIKSLKGASQSGDGCAGADGE